MSAHGVMLLENVYWPPLGIGTSKVTSLNDLAAEYHGFADAQAFLDSSPYLCDHQPPEYRRAGMLQWYMRNHGYPIGKQYATVMRHPDGAFAGHLRHLQETMVGWHGETAYLVTVEPVKELSPVAMPDLDLWGISPDAVDAYCGRYTVAQVREQFHMGRILLPHSETFTRIVEECERLSTDILGWQPGKGLDLALSPYVSWTLHAEAHTPVYLRQICDGPGGCGRKWDSRTGSKKCPDCTRTTTVRPLAPMGRSGRIMGAPA